jgi:hypothetical protein
MGLTDNLQGAVTFENCVFESNSVPPGGKGGGGYSQYCNVTLIRCVFRGNSSDLGGGGIAIMIGTASVTDCTFYGNESHVGGGAFFSEADVSVAGCTFSGNACAPDELGGAVFCQGPSGTIALENTILAFSTEGTGLSCDTSPLDPESVDLACCDVYGNAGDDWVGCIEDQLGANGNIAIDPQFCDAEAGDFTLDRQSPCLPGYNPTCGLIGAWAIGCPTSGVEGRSTLDENVSMRVRVPNPFHPPQRISYFVPPAAARQSVSLSIHDSEGRLI